MKSPYPINLKDDTYWRHLGWHAVARDADGHVISTCADGPDGIFTEWLRECFDQNLTVTNLRVTP